MTSSPKTATKSDGTTKYTATVTASADPISYENLTADVNSNFEFLKNEIQTKLDEVMKEIDDTLAIDAFVFDSVKDLSKAKEELDQLVSTLKSDLDTLCSTFESDINAVVAEVDNNFKWANKCDVNISIDTEPIPQTQGDS